MTDISRSDTMLCVATTNYDDTTPRVATHIAILKITLPIRKGFLLQKILRSWPPMQFLPDKQDYGVRLISLGTEHESFRLMKNRKSDIGEIFRGSLVGFLLILLFYIFYKVLLFFH
jgi:hypothetical protein